MDQVVKQNTIDLPASILEKIKTDSSDQVYLKLKKMSADKRELLNNNLEAVDFNLAIEVNRFLKHILGHLPGNLLDRWLIVQIIASAVTDYGNDTNQVLQAISAVINKKLKITKAIDWTKFANEAQGYLQALENLYEIQAYPEIEEASFYLNHFYQSFNSQAETLNLYKNSLNSFRELAGPMTTVEDVKNFTREKFLAKLDAEISPSNKQVNQNLLRANLSAWRLIPDMELNRLLMPANRDELLSKLIAAIRALRTVKLAYLSENQKVADYNQVFSWLRESVKQTWRLNDLANWKDENEARALVGL